MKKKIMSLVLAVVICLSVVSTVAAADTLVRVPSTLPGTDIEYNYVENVTVKIPGTEVTYDLSGVYEKVGLTYENGIPVYRFAFLEKSGEIIINQAGEYQSEILFDGKNRLGDALPSEHESGDELYPLFNYRNHLETTVMTKEAGLPDDAKVITEREWTVIYTDNSCAAWGNNDLAKVAKVEFWFGYGGVADNGFEQPYDLISTDGTELMDISLLDVNYTGLAKYTDGKWYYVVDGVVDFDYTGLVKHTNGIWYYVEDGILNWNYNGLWKHNGVWYYVQKGQINWKFTGLVKHTNGIWYYVQGAKLDWGYTGLVKHTTGSWFYVQKGQINFDYTGLVKHTNGTWYYVQKGKLNWNYNGLWKHNGTWYYVQKGQINWNYTGLVKHTNGIWYYVKGAKINWNYTGLVKHTNNKWYYVQKGQINFNYTGYVTYNGTRYKVVNGVKV